MHPHNSFVTLTFSDKTLLDPDLPFTGSVNLRDVQLFMKRLRKAYSDKTIRFFACGEYSPQHKRPHYHLLLFNQHFEDQKLFQDKNSKQLFTSKILSILWPYGFSTIGIVNYQTARYCAQYTLKKITGDLAPEHYTWPHPATGEFIRAEPEFVTMSTKPGIGSSWYDKYKSDCYPADFLIVDGKKHPVPKYYDLKLKKEAYGPHKNNVDPLDKLKRSRKRAAVKDRENHTPERLAVREELLKEKLKRSSRSGELQCFQDSIPSTTPKP
ncbi:replication initiator protein [Blackfly microvirus SF02]|uniref:Replication initiator protein n=1 Tax=Blackfly microvirus SF02 TaxID=2576452 RepID=A0A4P8PK17_9VIRU|nr:replication initiator protein [Blackfly microvirus SF02]